MPPNDMRKKVLIIAAILYMVKFAIGQVWVNTNLPGALGPIPGAITNPSAPQIGIFYIPVSVGFRTNVFLHDSPIPLHERLITSAEQIGALAAADSPTNVVCAGGWLFPDYFTLNTYPYPSTYTSYGATSQYNSVYIVPATHDRATDYLIQPQILRQQDWTPGIQFTNCEGIAVAARDGGGYVATWNAGAGDGATGTCTAVLGEFTRDITLIRESAGLTTTSFVWVADVEGTLRHHINTNTLGRANQEDKQQNLFYPFPYISPYLLLRNSAAWTHGIDLTCASPWNSYCNAGGRYFPATAITPQHVIGAKHWIAPTGTIYKWVDATNGVQSRVLTDIRFFEAHDMAVGLLDSPLDERITPATIFDANQLKYLRGKQGLQRAPGLYMVTLDQAERAWLTRSPVFEWEGLNWETTWMAYSGSTNLPFSRDVAVGGDSGNPSFAVIGTNVVLMSCYWHATDGPSYAPLKPLIEEAMADMGGSIYTNVAAPNLAAWPDHDTGIEYPDY